MIDTTDHHQLGEEEHVPCHRRFIPSYRIRCRVFGARLVTLGLAE
jgi:hypothetical protein